MFTPKLNQPTKLPVDLGIHHGHFILHALTGLLVFIGGIFADVQVVNYMRQRPHNVNWQNGQVESGYFITNRPLPSAGTDVVFGIVDDGTVVWKIKQ